MPYNKGKTAKGRSEQWQDHDTYNEAKKVEPPTREEEVHVGISRQALKNTPKSSYSILVDPYAAMNNPSTPYAIINPFNPTVGGRYAGDRNIDGGSVQQYANSATSGFLDCFDYGIVRARANYRYIPMNVKTQPSENPKQSSALIDEQIKSISEAVSTLQSSTYTQMNINNYAVITTMNMGTFKPDSYRKISEGNWVECASTDPGAKPLYIAREKVLYAMSRWYQVYLQRIINLFSCHNMMRLKQGTIVRNAWNREVADLNALFGLFNKKAWITFVDSISLSLEGEFIDIDWIPQFNMMSCSPSRRSDAMTSPILEVLLDYTMPDTYVVLERSTYGTTTTETVIMDAARLDGNSVLTMDGTAETNVSFDQVCQRFITYMSAYAIASWARKSSEHVSGTPTATQYYNAVKSLLDCIISTFSYVKTKSADLREAFDTLSRTGLITWSKGYRPRVIKSTDMLISRNLTTEAVFQLVMSGCPTATLDSATKRFRIYTLWDIYKGVPGYDFYNGGSQLTFSFKEFKGLEGDQDELIRYLPEALFFYNPSDVHIGAFLSRKGTEVEIQKVATVISEAPELCRLTPLKSQSEYELKMPFFVEGALENSEISHLTHAIEQVCGVCASGHVNQQNQPVADHIALDSDILAVYDIEIEDLSNAALSYARAYAPFRGATSNEGAVLGFFGTLAAKTKG